MSEGFIVAVPSNEPGGGLEAELAGHFGHWEDLRDGSKDVVEN